MSFFPRKKSLAKGNALLFSFLFADGNIHTIAYQSNKLDDNPLSTITKKCYT
jgi:hypothetical protein